MLSGSLPTRISWKIVLLSIFCLCLNQAALADGSFTPVFSPEMQATKISGEIRIDGELDDSGWHNASRADNFVEHRPGDQTEPPVHTVAYLTYDDSHLYVSFMCYDDPENIRASYCERDRVGSDDNIGLCLDTYGNATWAYTLNVNPYGIQGDALWSPNNGEDEGFDLIWESAGIVTDSGYQIEMAIPFSTLRFPNKEQQTWKVDFWRNHPRESRRSYSWAAYDRDEDCWPCQWGTISGINNVQPGKGIEIMPTWVGHKVGELRGRGKPESPFDFHDDAAVGEMSIGAKYSISSDITVEGSYNPDFSQIEADAGQIDVNSTFALFYPERRPFFQEGADLFRTLFNSFYTRTVNDPQFAAKATARFGKTGMGYLVARDDNSPITVPFEEFSSYLLTGKSTTNVFRLQHAVANGSQMGFIATDRRFDGGGSGSVISHDARFRITPSLSLAYQAVVSHTKEPNDTSITLSWMNDYVFWDDYTAAFDGESYWGTGGIAVLNWWTRTWNARINYWQVSPTYRADNGFDPKNNRRDGTVVVGYMHRPTSEIVDVINPYISAGTVWNYDGKKKSEFAAFNLQTQLKIAQASSYSQYQVKRENLGGIQFDGIWMASTNHNFRLGDPLAFGLNASYGHRIARRFLRMGMTTQAGGWVDIKPHDRVLIEQWVQHAKSDDLYSSNELYRQFIFRTRISYQLMRQLSLRLVGEYNEYKEQGSEMSKLWTVNPLLTYRINPFSIFYIGSTHGYERTFETDNLDYVSDSYRMTSRQFFMKLQYLFQV